MTADEGGEEVAADVWRGLIARPSTWLVKASKATINEGLVHMVTDNTQRASETIDEGKKRTGILTGDAIKYFPGLCRSPLQRVILRYPTSLFIGVS